MQFYPLVIVAQMRRFLSSSQIDCNVALHVDRFNERLQNGELSRSFSCNKEADVYRHSAAVWPVCMPVDKTYT